MSLLDSRCLKSIQIKLTDFNQNVFLICATGLQTRSLFFVGLKLVFLSKFPEEGIILLLSPQENKQTQNSDARRPWQLINLSSGWKFLVYLN